MAEKGKSNGLADLIKRPVWYQVARNYRMLLVVTCLILTLVSLVIPVMYFESTADPPFASQRSFFFYETNAWLFVLAAFLPLVVLLLRGAQPFGLILSLISFGSYLIVFFGFVLFVNQALLDPTILANMGFDVYCECIGNSCDCTSWLTGHSESGIIVYLACVILTFILVMIYGTEAYLKAKKKNSG